eukprot:scaffold130996_cov31-Prasinocladus_malaysianus.AAC.2
MRAVQVASVLNTHPKITAKLVHVTDCRKYCYNLKAKRADGLTHVIYVKYPCPRLVPALAFMTTSNAAILQKRIKENILK